jgi:hypothetical protein
MLHIVLILLSDFAIGLQHCRFFKASFIIYLFIQKYCYIQTVYKVFLIIQNIWTVLNFIYSFIISDFTMLHVKCFGAQIITGPNICIKTDFVSKLFS